MSRAARGPGFGGCRAVVHCERRALPQADTYGPGVLAALAVVVPLGLGGAVSPVMPTEPRK